MTAPARPTDQSDPATAPAEPLQGIRILDLTSVIMGPFATHILADLGADVIKVESPAGDLMRQYPPNRSPGMGGSFLQLNRNKRGLMLDLKRPEALAAFKRLIATTDVFLHAMRPRAIAKLGLTYEALRPLNPDMIYCGAYGFGVDGRYRDKAAYDDLIQAGAGFAALTQRIHGEPLYAPTVICDKLAGQAIAYAVLAALFHRQRGGGGQAVEVPMFETAIDYLTPEHYGGAAFEPPAGRFGFPRTLSKYRRPYRTADGYACILPYSDRNWRAFFDFIGQPALKDDPRFVTLGERTRHIDILYQLITEQAAKHSTADWVAFCDEASIPCMPVMDFDDLYDDPHVRDVGLFSVVDHPTEGAYRAIRRPVNFSKVPFKIRHHAPRLGEHTRQLLAEAGVSEAEIEAALAKDNVPEENR